MWSRWQLCRVSVLCLWETEQAEEFTGKTTSCARPLTQPACFLACQFCPSCPWHLPETNLEGGFLKIKCWLSWTDNLPRVCSWQREVLSKHNGLHKRGGIFMLSLEDTTYAIITPRTQHPSAGWWIPLIKDLLVLNSVQHALPQCLLCNIDLIILHPCSTCLEPDVPLLFIPQ